MGYTLHLGDCRDVLAMLPECSVDAVVTDPPAAISFMGRSWDSDKGGRTQWIAWMTDVMAECLRVLKPGGHAVVWALPRTSHWTATAIEDAGFEIRDVIAHVFGSGFPKSLDVSKAIDKARKDDPLWRVVGEWLRDQRHACGLTAKDVCAAIGAHGEVNHGGALSNWENGFSCPTWDQWLQLKTLLNFGDEMDAEVWRLNGRKGKPGEAWYEREVVGQGECGDPVAWYAGGKSAKLEYDITAPATDAARQWSGWGTALKPAREDWILARKPLAAPNIAQNVLAWGTGGLNVDGCRVNLAHGDRKSEGGATPIDARSRQSGFALTAGNNRDGLGRWPPNCAFSHAPDCVPVGTKRVRGTNRSNDRTGGCRYFMGGDKRAPVSGDYCDPDGTELVEAWECAPECSVAELDRQSGTSGSATRRVSKRPRGDSWRRMEGRDDRLGQVEAVDSYGDIGGASRFFPCFFEYNMGNNIRGQPCGAPFPEDVSTSVGKRTGSRSASLPIGGSGSKPTDQSLTDTRSITEIATPSTTTCPTCNLSATPSTTIYTPASMKTTGPSQTALSPDGANGVMDTSPSISSLSGEPGVTTDIADRAPSRTSESGATPTANTCEPTAESGTEGTTHPPNQSCACGAASSSNLSVEASNTVQCPATPNSTTASKGDFFPIFRYVPKASKADRGSGNQHPTVKNTELMRWLCRLVVPPGGTVLDPFAGSGSTLVAAIKEGFNCIGVEQDPDYFCTMQARCEAALSGQQRLPLGAD